MSTGLKLFCTDRSFRQTIPEKLLAWLVNRAAMNIELIFYIFQVLVEKLTSQVMCRQSCTQHSTRAAVQCHVRQLHQAWNPPGQPGSWSNCSHTQPLAGLPYAPVTCHHGNAPADPSHGQQVLKINISQLDLLLSIRWQDKIHCLTIRIHIE